MYLRLRFASLIAAGHLSGKQKELMFWRFFFSLLQKGVDVEQKKKKRHSCAAAGYIFTKPREPRLLLVMKCSHSKRGCPRTWEHSAASHYKNKVREMPVTFRE